MKFKIKRRILIIIGICVAVAICAIALYFEKENPIFAYNADVFAPISDMPTDGPLNDDGQEYEGVQDNEKDYINYWIQASRAIFLIRESGNENLKEARSIVDNMLATFERTGKFPRPVYKEYDYGWVSSMDAPVIMVASEMLYELTGEEKYQDFVYKLMEYVITDVESGGFSLYFTDDEGNEIVWPLEYASVDSTVDNAYFVLNGSLVGYLGMKMVANIYNNEPLDEYLNKVIKGYQYLLNEYHYEKLDWSFYMLNPLTVIPPHYMIFEKQLFSAIAEIDENEFWINEAQWRGDALKKVLEPQFYKTEKGIFFVMRRACAPHPYLLDIYTTKVRFLDEKGKELRCFTSNISGSCVERKDDFYEGEYLTGLVPENAKYYEVYSVKNEQQVVLLFSGEVYEKEWEECSVWDVMPESTFDVVRDTNEKYFLLDKDLHEKQEARLIFSLPEIQELSETNYYAIEVWNHSDQNYGLGLILYDTNGVGASRYYPTLVPGKNLILFNELGFSEINNIENIERIAVRIYTNNTQQKGAISVGNVYRFTNIYDLYQYQKQSEYKVTPQ